jgi:hypothetical protein
MQYLLLIKMASISCIKVPQYCNVFIPVSWLDLELGLFIYGSQTGPLIARQHGMRDEFLLCLYETFIPIPGNILLFWYILLFWVKKLNIACGGIFHPGKRASPLVSVYTLYSGETPILVSEISPLSSKISATAGASPLVHINSQYLLGYYKLHSEISLTELSRLADQPGFHINRPLHR